MAVPPTKKSNAVLVAAILIGWSGSAVAVDTDPMEGTLRVHRDEVVRTVDRRRLVGSNVCLWHEPNQLYDPTLQRHLRQLKPALLRIPGGSWSDEYYWNGKGVREGDAFDETKRKNGHWNIDFSDYAPGFRVQGSERELSDYHGALDVRALHKFVNDHGAEAMVTVNAGTGTPELAAEWVRWANLQNDYRVRYWEIGNELEGEWELGHILPDGTRLDGKAYAERFIKFSEAMKAVDPTIRIGGAVASNDQGGFTEDLLRLAGDHVDFVSFHTYPVEDSLASEASIFARARSVGPAMERFRSWIQAYQPERADEIEIGITEWNMKVIEDRDSADLMTGLWTSIWVGEMMRSGVAFAAQWDLLTKTAEGGHGAFFFGDRCLPKSQYWALHLWSRFMGDHQLGHEHRRLENVYVYPTRSGDELRILVVNIHRDREARLHLRIPGPSLASTAHAVRLSHAEYLWNPYTHEPVWSQAPVTQTLTLADEPVLHVPPFSAIAYRLFPQDTEPKAIGTSVPAGAPELDILLPESAPADLPIEGWVTVRDPSGKPMSGTVDAAGLRLEGPATSDRYAVHVREAAGRFFLQPTGTGPLTVRAEAGPIATQRVVRIEPVQERSQVYWRFDGDPAAWNADSSFLLAADDAVRPNQSVAAIHLQNVKPDENQDTLLAFHALPADLPKDRIGGVVMDVKVSPDFECADPLTQIIIILQSESAHWIELEALDVQDLKGPWKSVTVRLPDQAFHRAMGATYALRIQIAQPDSEKTAVTGRVYFDNVGFLLRSL